jgi:hypothetical protein
MKRFITLLAVLALAFVASATDLTGHSSSGCWYWELDTTISDGVFDTLNGTSDSSTLFSKRNLESGYQYVLAYQAATDAGTGSPEFVIRCFALDEDNDILYYVDVDTISGTTAGVADIEIGGKVVGSRYTLKLIAGGANGAANHAANQMKLYKRQVVVLNKNPK